MHFENAPVETTRALATFPRAGSPATDAAGSGEGRGAITLFLLFTRVGRERKGGVDRAKSCNKPLVASGDAPTDVTTDARDSPVRSGVWAGGAGAARWQPGVKCSNCSGDSITPRRTAGAVLDHRGG